MINESLALSYLTAGLAVLPANREKKFPTIGKWKIFQDRLPSELELKSWFANESDAICIITGKVSGNLEILDFDNHGELFDNWKQSITPELFSRLVIERTPSGGYHVVYRCKNEVGGNLKLAQGYRDGKLLTLIETRGNGGLFLCSPTKGYALVQNSYQSIPILTSHERKMLFEKAYGLNEHYPEIAESKLEDEHGVSSFIERPGDDYNARGDIRQLLLRYGWTSLKFIEGNEHFRRPGKTGSTCSATLKNNVFYVFSSNAAPFEPNHAYSPFQVYALLVHAGNFTEAAKTLFAMGYGEVQSVDDVDLTALLSGIHLQSEEHKSTILSLEELNKEYPEMRPVLIHGLLRIGETMNIIAPPKTGKSWLVTDLAYSVATGVPWFGFPCEQGKVLIIDNELHPETSSQRIPKVIQARQGNMNIAKRNIFIENQRGHLNNITAIGTRLDELKEFGFKLIIIDAFYRAMPDNMDENDNGKMTALYNMLDVYAQYLQCSFVLIHHTSKGNQAIKSVTDVGSGAGAQSRATDTHLVMRRHKETDVVVMDSAVRSFPPVQPMCLRWSFPIWNLDTALDPEDLDGKIEQHEKKDKVAIEDQVLMATDLLDKPMLRTEFIALLQLEMQISRNRARELIDCAKTMNLLCEEYYTDPDNKSRHGKLVTKNNLPENVRSV